VSVVDEIVQARPLLVADARMISFLQQFSWHEILKVKKRFETWTVS
jgi:hypothetical protein